MDSEEGKRKEAIGGMDSRLETPNNMPFVLVLILPMSGMIMWMMFDMTVALRSLSMMGSIMGWDMGGMVLIYCDTMFFKYLLVSAGRHGVVCGTYGSSMFFGFCADLSLAVSTNRAYVRVVKRPTLLAGVAKYELTLCSLQAACVRVAPVVTLFILIM
jgi:hypothetical protein